MSEDTVLCCKKSKVWLPDEFLTTIVGDCDRGKFEFTRTVCHPSVVLPNGNLYIEEQDGVEIPNREYHLEQLRCGGCGGEVEVREVDVRAILDNLRQREINMKKARRERESQRAAKQDPGKSDESTII